MVHAASQDVRTGRGCCGVDDAADARAVARMLGIRFRALNFRLEFESLKDHVVDSYLHGRTPNPCIRCNQWFKFGRLLQYAQAIGAVAIATGHYARVSSRGGRWCLERGVDRVKDQSYVLFGLSQDVLARTRFPLGERTKAEVRAMARRAGLPVAEKDESMDVCFLGKGGVRDLIAARRPGSLKDGVVVDGKGRTVATHSGAALYTIGQRRGLGGGASEPRYVVGMDAESNVVHVGSRRQAHVRRCRVGEVRWVSRGPLAPGRWIEAGVQVRAGNAVHPARVDSLGGGRIGIRFREPVFAVTPGQAAVLYDGDRVLAGGWIEKEEPRGESTREDEWTPPPSSRG